MVFFWWGYVLVTMFLAPLYRCSLHWWTQVYIYYLSGYSFDCSKLLNRVEPITQTRPEEKTKTKRDKKEKMEKRRKRRKWRKGEKGENEKKGKMEKMGKISKMEKKGENGENGENEEKGEKEEK